MKQDPSTYGTFHTGDAYIVLHVSTILWVQWRNDQARGPNHVQFSTSCASEIRKTTPFRPNAFTERLHPPKEKIVGRLTQEMCFRLSEHFVEENVSKSVIIIRLLISFRRPEGLEPASCPGTSTSGLDGSAPRTNPGRPPCIQWNWMIPWEVLQYSTERYI